MPLIKNKDLIDHNTFGISSIVAEYFEVNSGDVLSEAIDSPLPIFILGGGSNILLPEKLDRRVIHNRIEGIELIDETDDHVVVRIGGGMEWHQFVGWAVDRDLGGVENLALIPGTVGAAPIQNIGAYGIELKETFVKLTAIDMSSGQKLEYGLEECRFGYRDSVFKNRLKGAVFISYVTLRLTKANHHQPDLSYRSLREYLISSGNEEPSIREVFDAVIAIRRSKLPAPDQLGNSGSFFKNAIVPKEKWEELKINYHDLVYFKNIDGTYKIPTGWLIEKCGWKGKRTGNVGCYEKQALVLVNYGGATASEVRDLAQRIQNDVMNEFGIRIEPEVNVIES